jgi:hypothetical protein
MAWPYIFTRLVNQDEFLVAIRLLQPGTVVGRLRIKDGRDGMEPTITGSFERNHKRLMTGD